MAQLISVVMDTMRLNGFPMQVDTQNHVENALRFGFRGSAVDPALKSALMLAGVQIFIEEKVPEPERPQRKLEFSQQSQDWLLSLGIPGAAEAMKGKPTSN